MSIQKIAVLRRRQRRLRGGRRSDAARLPSAAVLAFGKHDCETRPSCGEIELIEGGVSKKAAPYFMSPHLPPVVQGVDLIVIATPAVGHEYLAKGLANYFTDGQRILLNPGHTGGSLHFANLLRQLGCKAQVQLCETVTLTYICRMPEPGRVEVYRRTTNLRCAALPGKAHGGTGARNSKRLSQRHRRGERVGNRLLQHQRDHASGGHARQRRLDRKNRRRFSLLPRRHHADDRRLDRCASTRSDSKSSGALGLTPLRFVDIFHRPD